MKIRTARQSYSCMQCGRCCRRHDVVVFPEELADLEKLEISGTSHPYTEHIGNTNLLRVQPGHPGDCIFLAADSTCLLHREHGYSRKPLSCRAHPLIISPTFPGEVGVMACFSCPGVMNQTGALLENQTAIIKNLVSELASADRGFSREQCCGLDKPAVLAVADALQQLLQENTEDFRLNLLRCRKLLQKLSGLEAGMLNDGVLRTELLAGLLKSRLQNDSEPVPTAPSLLLKMLFRSWLLTFIRRDGEHIGCGPVFLLKQALRSADFILGRGSWHAWGTEHPDFLFQQAEILTGKPDAVWEPAVWEASRRCLRARLESLLFFGPAYYGIPFYDGLAALLDSTLAVAAAARFHAAAAGAKHLRAADVEYAVATVDFCFGRSPLLGMKMHRSTEKILFGESFPRFLFHL